MARKYIHTLCSCDKVLTVALEDVAHIEEMIETIEEWERISAKQRVEIAKLQDEVCILERRVVELHQRLSTLLTNGTLCGRI